MRSQISRGGRATIAIALVLFSSACTDSALQPVGEAAATNRSKPDRELIPARGGDFEATFASLSQLPEDDVSRRIRRSFVRCDAIVAGMNGDLVISPIALPKLKGRLGELGKARIVEGKILRQRDGASIRLQCGLPVDVSVEEALGSLTYEIIESRLKKAGKGRIYGAARAMALRTAISLRGMLEAEALGLMNEAQASPAGAQMTDMAPSDCSSGPNPSGCQNLAAFVVVADYLPWYTPGGGGSSGGSGGFDYVGRSNTDEQYLQDDLGIPYCDVNYCDQPPAPGDCPQPDAESKAVATMLKNTTVGACPTAQATSRDALCVALWIQACETLGGAVSGDCSNLPPENRRHARSMITLDYSGNSNSVTSLHISDSCSQYPVIGTDCTPRLPTVRRQDLFQFRDPNVNAYWDFMSNGTYTLQISFRISLFTWAGPAVPHIDQTFSFSKEAGGAISVQGVGDAFPSAYIVRGNGNGGWEDSGIFLKEGKSWYLFAMFPNRAYCMTLPG